MDIKTNKVGIKNKRWPESREWAELKPTQGVGPYYPLKNEEKSI
jgi:hypothetical protein